MNISIERPKYLNLLINNKNNGFPKVITGVRRCGKSFLLKNLYKTYLLKSGVKESNIISVDLDDDKNADLRDPINLGNYVRKLCSSQVIYYVFLDEIQLVFTIVNPSLTGGKHILAKKSDKEVVSFVDVVLGLSHEKNIDLYVTGSNSKMLSKDIVTEFRDKATNINLLPLSFEEFYAYRGGSKNDAIFEYMQYGGMPLSVLKEEGDKRKYLIDLFNTTYFKDILDHNHLRKSESLDELCNILSDSVGSLINSKKIADTYRSVKKQNIDEDTVNRYLAYFEDSFLLREARRFDIKGRKEIGALRKFYFVDTGLRNARLNFSFPDEGNLLENLVYNELIYNDFIVNVGCFDNIEQNESGSSVRKSYEIDFYASKSLKKYYIQVSSSLDSAKAKAREIKPFKYLKDSFQRIIVVNKPINETIDENGIILIGAADFFLRFLKRD
jgi:uncharacterized protein